MPAKKQCKFCGLAADETAYLVTNRDVEPKRRLPVNICWRCKGTISFENDYRAEYVKNYKGFRGDMYEVQIVIWEGSGKVHPMCWAEDLKTAVIIKEALKKVYPETQFRKGFKDGKHDFHGHNQRIEIRTEPINRKDLAKLVEVRGL